MLARSEHGGGGDSGWFRRTLKPLRACKYALPSVGEARKVLERLQETASDEAFDAVKARIMRPYADTVLDEESGEWVRVGDPDRLAELAREREGVRGFCVGRIDFGS